MPTPHTTARLEARISTELHAMLKRAAEIQGLTMTDFVIAAPRCRPCAWAAWPSIRHSLAGDRAPPLPLFCDRVAS